MSKEILPLLRFSQHNGNLKPITIDNLAKLVTSGSRDWAQYYAQSGAKFIRMTNLCRETSTMNLANLKFVDIPKGSTDGFRTKLEYGDVLISITAELGKIGIVPVNLGEAYINQHIALIKPKLTKDGEFLAHYLTAPQSHKRLNRLNDSGAKSGLNLKSIKQFVVYIPERKEQQKIADFLTSVDTKISQLTEKHRLLKEYKKGVMQQIFSQQIRFKDKNGQMFPEWNVMNFSDFLIPKIRKKKKPTCSFLSLGIRSHVRGIFHKPEFSPDEISLDELYEVNENDLVVNITFAWEGAIAIASARDHGGLVSHRFPTFEFKSSKAVPEYFKHVIHDLRLRYILQNISPGGAGRNRVLNKNDFLKIQWSLPCVQEQQKIAKFLQSLDSKINAVAEQIEQTKQFKKGLLQQMFV